MKKFLFIVTLIMGIVLSVNAQTELVDNGTAKDNWYVGASIGGNVWNDKLSWTMFNSKSNVGNCDTNSWWRTQTFSANVLVGKYVNPYLFGEIEFSGLFNLRGENEFMDGHNLSGKIGVNLTNIILGYKGNRRTFELEVLGGGGWLYRYNRHLTDGTAVIGSTMSVVGAVRGNINLNDAWAITITPEYMWIPKNISTAKINTECVNLYVGVKYRIPSKRGNFPLCKLYDQNEVDALHSSIATLKETNANLSKANADLAETLKKLVGNGERVVVHTQNVGSVYFDKGKSEVNDVNMDAIIETLKSTNGAIVLTGTTSPEGNEKFNKTLAVDRAEAVKDALIKCGIAEDRIFIKNGYESQRSVVITIE